MIYQRHAQHGLHIAYTSQGAQSNRKNGWTDISIDEFYKDDSSIEKPSVLAKQDELKRRDPPRRMSVVSDSREALVKAHEAKFGFKPDGRLGNESIKKVLSERIPPSRPKFLESSSSI